MVSLGAKSLSPSIVTVPDLQEALRRLIHLLGQILWQHTKLTRKGPSIAQQSVDDKITKSDHGPRMLNPAAIFAETFASHLTNLYDQAYGKHEPRFAYSIHEG